MKVLSLLTVVPFLLTTSVPAQEPPDTVMLLCINGLADAQYRELRQVCTAEIPELQGPMEEAQAAWEKRNEAARSRFDTACRERLSELQRDDKAAYDALQEQARQLREYGLKQMRTADLGSTCRDYMEGMRTPGRMDAPESLIEELVSPGSSLRHPVDEPAGGPPAIDIIPAPAAVSVGIPASPDPSGTVGYPGTPRPAASDQEE